MELNRSTSAGYHLVRHKDDTQTQQGIIRTDILIVATELI